VLFEQQVPATNVRDIARSVLLDSRFQSYLALGGPAWLHNKI
ncbi:unnamed protein product, partial [Brassica oleracea]